MFEFDHRIAVSTVLEGLDERIARFKKESVVPFRYYRGNISLINNPSLVGQLASNSNRDFVVVPVWP